VDTGRIKFTSDNGRYLIVPQSGSNQMHQGSDSSVSLPQVPHQSRLAQELRIQLCILCTHCAPQDSGQSGQDQIGPNSGTGTVDQLTQR